MVKLWNSCCCPWTGFVLAILLSFQPAGGFRFSRSGGGPRKLVGSQPQQPDHYDLFRNKATGNAEGRQPPILFPRGGSRAMAATEGAGALRRRAARQIVPLGTALTIGSFSILEILESLREVRERQLGHAHGVAILAFIRLCRSIAILQTQVEEFEEGIEKIVGEEEASKSSNILAVLGKLLISPFVTITACLLAAFASVVEVIDDFKPGAHHGAAFLALSELYYQCRRLLHYRKKGKPASGNDKKVSTFWTPIQRFVSKIPVGMMIAVAAAGYAAFEVYEDMQPGAHHGVLILALAECIENINRSKILH